MRRVTATTCWILSSSHSRSYGTAKSGVGISAMSVLRPDLMMKCVVPVIMAGIIAVRKIPVVVHRAASHVHGT